MNDLTVIKESFQTHNVADKVAFGRGSGSDPVYIVWASSCKKFGFCGITVLPRFLALCSPEAHVLIFEKGEDSFALPGPIKDVFDDAYIVKCSFTPQKDLEVMQRITNTDPNYIFDITQHANYFFPSAGVSHVFKENLDGKMFELLSFSRSAQEVTLFSLIQSSRSSSFAIWLITSCLASKEIGLDGNHNIVAHTRQLLLQGNNKMLQKDPYYIPTSEISLTKADFKAFKTWQPLRRTVANHWEKIKEDKNHKLEAGIVCRGCGLPEMVKHDCQIPLTCYYPLCRDSTDHSTVTCDTLQARCKVCKWEGHQLDCGHVNSKYKIIYMNHLFRLFSPHGEKRYQKKDNLRTSKLAAQQVMSVDALAQSGSSSGTADTGMFSKLSNEHGKKLNQNHNAESKQVQKLVTKFEAMEMPKKLESKKETSNNEDNLKTELRTFEGKEPNMEKNVTKMERSKEDLRKFKTEQKTVDEAETHLFQTKKANYNEEGAKPKAQHFKTGNASERNNKTGPGFYKKGYEPREFKGKYLTKIKSICCYCC